ncbi:sugar ABC transporter permease [Clostridium polynesiense]|uniref:sugar ABC transporter permease n=1 Tax=Clostridium polynesiense TaxID=1325933 RepID=UPI0005913FDC|nr:sugar ABC transporter permease [Clostridium polynesiense]
MKSYSFKKKLSNGLIYSILSLLSIIWIAPIIWLVIISFRGDDTGPYPSKVLPQSFTLDNYIKLFTETSLFNYPRWYLNTITVAIFSCIISTILVLMIGYAFSRLRFPSRTKLMNIGLILGMFPGFMTMIAIYHVLKLIGLDQSLIALILVYSGGSCLSYFIAKGFFDTIPLALDEAATIDGATKSQIFWKITLPISKPIVVYTVLTSFIAPWIDFIFVSVIMRDNYNNYTLALGLFQMISRENISKYFTQFTAGAVLVAIPITLLFVKMQKYYVEGVTGGSVKG